MGHYPYLPPTESANRGLLTPFDDFDACGSSSQVLLACFYFFFYVAHIMDKNNNFFKAPLCKNLKLGVVRFILIVFKSDS